MKHYASSIRQSGAPIEYSSNMYKHLYMAMIKTEYQMSKKINFLNHIVKCNRRLEALRSNASEIDGYSCFFGKNATLEKVCSKKSIWQQRAAFAFYYFWNVVCVTIIIVVIICFLHGQTGQHIMAGFQTHLNMKVLHLYDQGRNSASCSHNADTASKRQQILFRILQPDIVTHLLMSLDSYMDENHLTSGEVHIFMNLNGLDISK